MEKTFYVRPAVGEHIETEVVLPPETRSSLFGRVTDSGGLAVDNAVVTLFEAVEGHSDRLNRLACQYTDENGHFLLGPLESGRLYVVKVYKNNIKLRQLELTVD